jgi:hypothetical protein
MRVRESACRLLFETSPLDLRLRTGWPMIGPVDLAKDFQAVELREWSGWGGENGFQRPTQNESL